MRLGKFSKSLRRLTGLAVLAAAVSVSGCNKSSGGGGSKKASDRLKWVQKPTSGKQSGKIIKIPGLQVTFEQPEVLYVYKECSEAAHSDQTDEGWVPVITCMSTYGGDELDDERADVALTIYAGEKKTIINERGVAILKAEYVQQGYKVDEIIYIEDYQGKRGRRGIQSVLHVMDADGKYPEREIQRFRFPVGDIVFVAQVDYPYGDDRSGIESDWQRILWNFQLDEDGPLYPDQEVDGEDAG